MDRQEVKKIDCKQGEILLGSMLVYKVDEGYEYCIIDLCEEKPYTRIGYEYSQKGLLERIADFHRRYVGDVEFKETA